MLIDILQEVNEGRAEKGQGSKAGRKKYTTPEGKKSKPVKARKSRVRIFDTIQDALKSSAPYGTIFSTKGADRLYVISRKKWGKDKESQVGVRIAKGFTPGSATPSASWPSIKAHSIRTMLKHGGSKSKRLTAKYGAGKKRPEERRYSGKKKLKESIEALHEALPVIPTVVSALRTVGTKIGFRRAATKAAKSTAKKAVVKQSAQVATKLATDTDKGTQDGGGQDISHTKYEGPSLREKVSYLHLFIETVELTPEEGEALKKGAGRRAGKSRANRRDREKARQLLKQGEKQKAARTPPKVDPEHKKESVPTPKSFPLAIRRPDAPHVADPEQKKKIQRKQAALASKKKSTETDKPDKPSPGSSFPSADDIGVAVAKHGPYGKKDPKKRKVAPWRRGGRALGIGTAVVAGATKIMRASMEKPFSKQKIR
jgi:hypothetical protein